METLGGSAVMGAASLLRFSTWLYVASAGVPIVTRCARQGAGDLHAETACATPTMSGSVAWVRRGRARFVNGPPGAPVSGVASRRPSGAGASFVRRTVRSFFVAGVTRGLSLFGVPHVALKSIYQRRTLMDASPTLTLVFVAHVLSASDMAAFGLQTLPPAMVSLCSICGNAVDLALSRKDSVFCASIDHIVPRSRGGSDHPDNLALAHFWCNAVKSDREGFVMP